MIESCFFIQSDILCPIFGESRPFFGNVIMEMFGLEALFFCFLFVSTILPSFPAFQIENFLVFHFIYYGGMNKVTPKISTS